MLDERTSRGREGGEGGGAGAGAGGHGGGRDERRKGVFKQKRTVACARGCVRAVQGFMEAIELAIASCAGAVVGTQHR